MFRRKEPPEKEKMMGNRHAFSLEGGEELSRMGATWFVSYCYYDKINETHSNWKNVGTHKKRKSIYNRTAQYHQLWLKKVLEMNPKQLRKNKVNLTWDEIQKMAQELLNM